MTTRTARPRKSPTRSTSAWRRSMSTSVEDDDAYVNSWRKPMTKRIDLRPIDSIRPPDQWLDIADRHPRETATPPPSNGHVRRVVTVVTALALALGGLVLLLSAFRDVGHRAIGSVTPTAAPALPELIVFSTADDRIAVLRPDGSGERVLTTGDEGGAAAA